MNQAYLFKEATLENLLNRELTSSKCSSSFLFSFLLIPFAKRGYTEGGSNIPCFCSNSVAPSLVLPIDSGSPPGSSPQSTVSPAFNLETKVSKDSQPARRAHSICLSLIRLLNSFKSSWGEFPPVVV